MTLAKRLHLFLRVLPIVGLFALAKVAFHVLGLEFMPVDGLVTSLIAGSIFLIGFLLVQVLGDYREAERIPADIRTALEAILDDVKFVARREPKVDLAVFRAALADIVEAFDEGLGVKARHCDLDALSELFGQLQDLDTSERFLVSLKGEQDKLRRAIFRVAHIQKMEFVPSVHVLVQTIVIASLFVLLFLKTQDAWESLLILVFVGYLFVYSLMLIGHLDQPFREGEGSVDDISLFQLKEFLAKIRAET